MAENSGIDTRSIALIAAGVLTVAIVGGGVAFYTGAVDTTVDTTDGPTGDTTGFDYPEGANSDTVNLTVLSQTHERTLTEREFKITTRSTSETADEYQYNTLEATYGMERTALVRSNNAGVFTLYKQSDQSTSYIRSNTTSGIEYSSRQSRPTAGNGRMFLENSADQYDIEFANTTSLDGEEVARYRITGLREELQTNQTTNFNVSGTLVVSEDGYAKSFELAAVSASNETALRSSSQSVVIENVDSTTVEEPDWLDEVPNQTATDSR